MKILHVSDLHGVYDWYAWVAAQAKNPALGIDAVVITGDLIDALGDHPKQDAILAEDAITAIRQGGMPVIICSGNHDRALTWPWLERQEPRTTHLNGLSITSLPYDVLSYSKLAELAREGRSRKQPWMVLQHVPPECAKTIGDSKPDGTSSLLSFGPDYLLSGHIHSAPWQQEGSWIDYISSALLPSPTFMFNPGCRMSYDIPCHIFIDTTRRTADWVVNGEKAIFLELDNCVA